MMLLDFTVMEGVQVAWLAPAACILAFLLIVSFRMFDSKIGSIISIVAIASGFAIFLYVFGQFNESGPAEFAREWFTIGSTKITLGMAIDQLSVVMLGVITFVALLVQIYSVSYMEEESRFGWFFGVHSLFAASMLILVLANNLLLLYVAWELVGLCSYLLIGFWYEKRSASEAAKKAFITTRIGDVGLLIGIILLYRTAGTFDTSTIIHIAQEGGFADSTLMAAVLLIFLGAMGKSAQFPLHVWLPDAMEGPTPVSALIHAATMVVAGIYLVARIFPLFEVADPSLTVVAVVGLSTAVIAASIALVMTDLKKILAYSTVSHLGFMMLALGSGAYVVAMFHLFTHAFAKALLFLSAGSVDHGTGGKRDIRQLGGLRKKMPITFVTFSIGALALAGVPPLGGFFSKDEIMMAVMDGRHPVFFLIAIIAAFMSSVYMIRALILVFFGELKPENQEAHESPALITAPLLILAGISLVAGLVLSGWQDFFNAKHHDINFLVLALSLLASLGGLFLGWAIYSKEWISSRDVAAKFGDLEKYASNGYYLDVGYQWCIDRIVLVVARIVSLFDRIVVNDVAVNGTGYSVFLSGFKLRYVETGKVYNYALAMVVGILVVGLSIYWGLI